MQPEASLHSLDSILAVGLDVGYGLSPDITVGVHVPYIMRKDIVEAGQGPDPEIEHLGDSDGFGDPTLYGLWRFYEDKPSDISMGLIAGLKLPIGKDDNVADTGETFETEFQPSSGSWDPFAGLAWSRSIGKFNLAASTIYTFAMSGTANTNLGDLWTYNFATGYGLGGAADMHWNAALELNGGWHDREQISGEAHRPEQRRQLAVCLAGRHRHGAQLVRRTRAGLTRSTRASMAPRTTSAAAFWLAFVHDHP